MADSPYVFDVTAQNFQQYLLEYSRHAPVLVDFWADWCQPCKTLMPLLAKLADEYQGGFLLAKVNTEQQPQLAQHFKVRSIPTVKIFKNGQIVDEFSGALPEAELRKIINKHRSHRTEPYRQQALMLSEQGDHDAAINILQQVLQHEPDFYEAALDLAGILLAQGQGEAAETILKTIPTDASIDQDVLKQLLAEAKRLKLKAQVGNVDMSALEQRIAANPDDLTAKLELAKLKIANDQIEEGLDLYFQVHQKDSSFQEGAGKKGLFASFELLGSGHPLVKRYRNKIFSMLY
jgi:putative thioredoxin